MFDISTIVARDTAAVHLKSATGDYLYSDGKPVRIHVYGPGSAQFGAIEARQTQRAIKRREDNDGRPSIPSPEDRIAEEAEDLAAITVSFENLAYPAAEGVIGAPLFAALYADQRLGFINAQVRKFVSDWGNFTGGSKAA